MRQVVWRKSNPSVLEFRELSCSTCAEKCVHYSMKEVVFAQDEESSDLDSPATVPEGK